MLSEHLLKLVCYSSKPTWDDFGHLTSRGNRQVRSFSLVDRFGPGIWDEVKGKRVLDYGCGYGIDVVEMRKHGIEAVGLERKPTLIEGARSNAEKAGVWAEFILPHETDGLLGTFDCVLSVNAFEHYQRADKVLNKMHSLLKPDGNVLIYFSPPWLHPYGAHCQEMTPFPWIQLFPEKAVMKMRHEFYDETPATRYEDAGAGLNKMTIARFKHIVEHSGFKFKSLTLTGIRGLQAPTKVPLLREFTTAAIRAELLQR
jgi:SAM-dependent methyltransferase